jgi:hypothetical protein
LSACPSFSPVCLSFRTFVSLYLFLLN